MIKSAVSTLRSDAVPLSSAAKTMDHAGFVSGTSGGDGLVIMREVKSSTALTSQVVLTCNTPQQNRTCTTTPCRRSGMGCTAMIVVVLKQQRARTVESSQAQFCQVKSSHSLMCQGTCWNLTNLCHGKTSMATSTALASHSHRHPLRPRQSHATLPRLYTIRAL